VATNIHIDQAEIEDESPVALEGVFIEPLLVSVVSSYRILEGVAAERVEDLL
jgi:hypothetical protein